jgi:excinuclease UvrABC nuclease subunit
LKGDDMREWVNLGPLNETETDFSIYSKDIGVYRARLNNEIVYIGKATELNNGGFRKRLRDYTRKSNSARNYPSGRLMHENRDKLMIEIIITERGNAGVQFAELLEIGLIKEYRPSWNDLDN